MRIGKYIDELEKNEDNEELEDIKEKIKELKRKRAEKRNELSKDGRDAKQSLLNQFEDQLRDILDVDWTSRGNSFLEVFVDRQAKVSIFAEGYFQSSDKEVTFKIRSEDINDINHSIHESETVDSVVKEIVQIIKDDQQFNEQRFFGLKKGGEHHVEIERS